MITNVISQLPSHTSTISFDNGDLNILKKVSIKTTGHTQIILGTINGLAINGFGYVALSPSGATTINGIAAGTNGELLFLTNTLSANITINNNSASASAGDKIFTQSGSAVTLAEDQSMMLLYNGTVWSQIG